MEAKDTVIQGNITGLTEAQRSLVDILLLKQAEVAFREGLHKGVGAKEAAWWWQNDGTDDLESLSCPILIEADLLRQLVEDSKKRVVKDVIWDMITCGGSSVPLMEIHRLKAKFDVK